MCSSRGPVTQETLCCSCVLYYKHTWKVNRAPSVHKGELYVAKIDKNWQGVLVKAILTNGFVSVCPATQLAGLSQRQWSVEASMLFRNHAEDRTLVAKVQRVQKCSEVQGETWQQRWTVFLVETSHEDQDL